MSANDRQVGGSHYRSKEGEQHWDRLIRLWGWPRAKVYFVGQATKYLERHEQKGGLQDLEKALHFCEKIVEEERKHQATQTHKTSVTDHTSSQEDDPVTEPGGVEPVSRTLEDWRFNG